jgi:hypothetical protein
MTTIGTDDRFEAIGAEADALRRGAEPPAPDDLAEMASGASLVDQFLAEIAEAIRQVCVAGLAFPAPELPSTLDDLAERAAALRLATAFETLKRLRVRVAAVLAEPALEQRPALSADPGKRPNASSLGPASSSASTIWSPCKAAWRPRPAARALPCPPTPPPCPAAR